MATIDRTKAPDFIPFKNFKIKEAETLSLKNGAPLFLLRSGNQPVAQIDFVFRAGVRHETEIGQAFFTAKLLKEGTSSLSSSEISGFFDQYGSFLEINPGLDQLTVSLFSLTKHLSKLIPFLKTIIYDAVFPDKELEIQKNIKIQNIKVENDKNNVLASKMLRIALFGENHPYGRTLNEDQIGKLSNEHLQRFHQTNIVNNLEIIAGGDFSSTHLDLLETHFGEIPLIHNNNIDQLDPGKSDIIQNTIEKKDSLQSSIRLGKHIIQKKHKDYSKLSVVIEILGGYFGSRLMKNIREEKGYTYGIQASLVNLQKAGFLIIGTDVKKSYTQNTIGEIQKEISRLQHEPVPQEELDTVRNYLVGAFQSSITTPFSLADKFKSIYYHGLGYDYFQTYLKSIQSINQKDILELSQKYLQIDSFNEIVVGGK